MDPIAKRFSEFQGTLNILEYVGLFFLVLIVSETVWDFLRDERKNLHESFSNFAIALGNVVLERVVFGVVFLAGLIVAEYFAFWKIPLTWWSWVLAVVVADFTYYWMHRFEHEVRILWAHHSVHHSSPEFNLTTALRLAWVEGLVEWIFFVPMILLGFDLVQTVIGISIVVAYQTWIHTEKVGKLGWLDRVFNTPSVHRVHHGSNRVYLDKNYGGILIIWDRLFGTFQAESEQVIYGLTEPVGTANPVTVNFHEYRRIWRDLRKAKSTREVFGFVFGGPGWRPRR